MTCGWTELRKGLSWGLGLALWASFPGFATGDFTFRLAEGKRFVVSLHDGHLISASQGRSPIVQGCFDEYWQEGENGEIVGRTSEAQDRVTAVQGDPNRLRLECRNEAWGLRLTKVYAPLAGSEGLRKTVVVHPIRRPGGLHLFSRIRLAEPFRRAAWLYTPRQSWVGRRLLYGVRPLTEVTEPITSGSGWDNRFVVAFQPDRSVALAHWRTSVEGTWVPAHGVITEWGRESPFALTYLPDGWRWRLLHTVDGQRASASADYVLFRGDWYEAWAIYQNRPDRKATYRHLEATPAWTQRVKYGTFWNPPHYRDWVPAVKQLCERLGPEAYLTLGVFGWSLDGDYETEHPFLMQTLHLVLTPRYFRQAIAALQEHPQAKVGLYIQGGLIDSESQCYRDHPDWVMRGADGQPIDSGFEDNAVGKMYTANPLVEEWVEHHLARIRAVCQAYHCGFIYLDGGGYWEGVDRARRQAIHFAHCRRLNESVLRTVRSTGRDRGLLINSQNAPFADLSWLECGYFDPSVPWRETLDFCFDTECQSDPRYTLEPLYWRDNDRYLAMCIAFGFTPCGEVGPEKPEATWRAVEAAWQMKQARLIYHSAATSPVWWRDGVPIATFAMRRGQEIVVPVLNFSDREEVEVTVDLEMVGLRPEKPIEATFYQPLLSADLQPIEPAKLSGGKATFKLKVPLSWRGITLLTIPVDPFAHGRRFGRGVNPREEDSMTVSQTSPAAAPGAFDEWVHQARSRAADAGVFREAVSALASGSALPPVAFRLGDQTQAECLGRARRTHSVRPDPAGTVHDLTYEDPATGLTCRIELLEFHDFPAVEWVAYFTQAGKAPLPVLTEVAALDFTWRCEGDAFLYRAPGADETPYDFQFQRVPLQTIRAQRASVALSAGDQGRSSVDWLPFFNLHSGDDGLIVALGWTGQWYAQIDRDGPQARLRAGMEGLYLALQPGETIRTPRVLLLYWRGQVIDGQNQLRRLLLRYHTPQIAGRPVEVPSCYGAWGGSPTPVHLRQIELIQEKQLPYDCYWIDAGWYGTSDKPCPNVFQGEWWKTGDWRVNRNYHPDGLQPLSEKAHAAGLQFLLWVEPERALHGAPVTLEHPEWFLQRHPGQPRQEGENLLLNLGHPQARQWAIELISGLIRDNGLDWYRQDFNIAPLEFWRAADAPDRQGLTEIRYIEGLYAFWDELLRRHPGLRIDNCASGGRRLDLETLSRSVPLWRNDYNCFPHLDPEIVQVHGFGLTHWLPLHATSPFNNVPGDTYRFRSVIAPGVVFSLDEGGNVRYDEQTYPWDWHRKMLADVRRARPFWYGDLYPLTSCSPAPDAWIALQLHRPDLNAGLILAFRRAASPITAANFRLGGILPASDYVFEDADSGATWTVSGEKLATSGLPFRIDTPRSSRLVFYTGARSTSES